MLFETQILSKFNSHINNKKVLIVALDWGLGHLTRCIPIIYGLLANGNQVVLGGNDVAQKVWQNHFPQLAFVPFHGYNIRYGRSKIGTMLKFVFQLPKIYFAAKREQQQLKALQVKELFDFIISDNRLGLYHSNATSIYITHQLCIQSPFGFTTRWLQKIHYRYISNFDLCWIPDEEEMKNSFAGALSHPEQMPPTPVKYIGILSSWPTIPSLAQQYVCTIILSGPEPQRTILENLLLQQLAQIAGKVALVRGLPTETFAINAPANTSVFNYLPAKDLAQMVACSALVICRAGYSTVMDLAHAKKPALLIPTPGQSEQEYLAQHLHGKGQFIYQPQEHIDLQKAAKEILPSVYGADWRTW